MRKKSRTSSQIRIERIQSRMTEVISLIIQNELKDPSVSPLASVLRVNVTKDLRYAKVFVTVMGTDEEKNETIAALKRATGYIKKEIALRLNLRIVPQPTFVLDNSIDYGMRINDILSKLNGNEQ